MRMIDSVSLQTTLFLIGDNSSDEQWCPAEVELYSFDWHFSVITFLQCNKQRFMLQISHVRIKYVFPSRVTLGSIVVYKEPSSCFQA